MHAFSRCFCACAKPCFLPLEIDIFVQNFDFTSESGERKIGAPGPLGPSVRKTSCFSAVSACARNHVFLRRFCDSGAQFFENRGILRGSRPCAVKNPCVFDDSCVYFDNFMFFYVFSKVRFSKTSCFTCLERLGVSKNVKTPSVFACLTRKHVKTRSFAALFRHPVGKTSCLFAIF